MAEIKEASINNKREKRAMITASIGCTLLIIGVNLPLYIAKVLSVDSTISRVNKEGLLLLIAAIAAIVLVYKRKIKYTLITVIVTAAIQIHYMFLFTTIKDFKSISIGFYVQWVAALLMLIATIMIPKTKNDNNSDNANSNDMSLEDKTSSEKKNISLQDKMLVNDTFNIKDFKWLVPTLVACVGILVLFDKDIMFDVQNNAGNVAAQVQNTDVPVVSYKGTTEEIINYDLVEEKCCVNIQNAFVLNDNGTLIVMIEFVFKNRTDTAINFGNTVIIDITQDQNYLQSAKDMQSTVFNLDTSDSSVEKDETCSVFLPFLLDNDTDDVGVNIKMAENPSVTVCTKSVKLNNLYYTTGNNQNGEDPYDELENSKSPDKTVNSSETSNKTEKPTKSSSPSSVETTKESTKTAVPAKTSTPTKTTEPVVTIEPTVAPTPEPTSFTVYFTKPLGWGDSINAYIYLEDSSGVKEYNRAWPGVQMSSTSSGKYSIIIPNEWEGKYIIFNDGNGNQYPGGGAQGLAIVKSKEYSVQ